MQSSEKVGSDPMGERREAEGTGLEKKLVTLTERERRETESSSEQGNAKKDRRPEESV